MEKITKYRIESAKILFEDIEKSREIINPAHMSTHYKSDADLQKWAKEKYIELRNACDNDESLKAFEALINDPSNPDSIISFIVWFISLSAIVPKPDYSDFTIYSDPITKIINLLSVHDDALKRARKQYDCEAYEAGNNDSFQDQNNAGPVDPDNAEKENTATPATPDNTTGNNPDNASNQGSIPSKILIPITAKDCILLPDRKYILDGIIEDETITVFSGKEKIGKTYVLMHMALCMSAKLPWLGFQTMGDVQGKILWLNFDMSRITAKRRINEICNGIKKDWDTKNPHMFDNFELMDDQVFRDAGCNDRFQFLTNSNAVEALKKYIIAHDIKVCFIDNLIQIEGGADENSSKDIQMVFSNLKKLRDETHCSFIVIHHTGKNGERGRGSSDIFAETDLNLQLDQCTNADQLLLRTDGARNTAMHNIGMQKKFLQRLDNTWNCPMTDNNGHEINDFVLERIDTDGLVSNNASKTTQGKKADTLEKNITKILLMFAKTGNKPLSKTAILDTCNKDESCKLTGAKQAQYEAVDKAYNEGKLLKNSANMFYTP